MRIKEIGEISLERELDSRLEDKRKNLSLAVAMASGLVWKEKVYSFYEVIAKELLEIFDENLLGNAGIILNEFNYNFKKVYIGENTLMYNRNNLFLNATKKLDVKSFLNQVLVYIDNKKIPSYLTTKEKDKMFLYLTKEEIHIINQCYNKQELNGDKFFYNNIGNKELMNILVKSGYFDMSIYDYILLMSTGKYSYKLETENIEFKKTYNNYILELGAYVAKQIEIYLNK